MVRPAIAPTRPPSGGHRRAGPATRVVVLPLVLLAGAAFGADSTTNKCIDARGNARHGDAPCPMPTPAHSPPNERGAATTDRVTRVDGPRRTPETVPVLRVDEPDALASSAEVTELVAAAELCLRFPRFSREHGERVDAWLLRNASLIDGVRRDAQAAQAMAGRLQAARRPLGREDQGPLEGYCMKLAPRFLPKLPLIVGANAPRAATVQPAGPSIVGTWRLVSVTDTASGEAIIPALSYLSRYYPDGAVVYWTVPPTEVRRMTYQTEPGQMLLGGAPLAYGAKLQVTHDTMRFLNGGGGEQLHFRTKSDLEPPIATGTAQDGKPLPPAAGSGIAPSIPRSAARVDDKPPPRIPGAP